MNEDMIMDDVYGGFAFNRILEAEKQLLDKA